MRLVYSLPLAALLLLNIALVAIGTYVGGTVLYSEHNALRAVRQLNDLLRAQEFLSRERGPTNGALGPQRQQCGAKKGDREPRR